MFRPAPLPFILVVTLSQLAACGDDPSVVADSIVADSSTANSSVTEVARNEASPSLELGSVTTTPAATSGTGEVWRGAMSWQAPAHWVEVDTSGRPFVPGEYQLPGHSEESPAGCLISNGQKADGKTPEKLRSKVDNNARRTDLKTVAGKSVRSAVGLTEHARGNYDWIEGFVEGSYVDDGTAFNRREPPLVVEGYAARTAVPHIPGPPFSIRCWAPAGTMEKESDAFEKWLGTFEIAPI